MGHKEFVREFFPGSYVSMYGTPDREAVADESAEAGIADAQAEREAVQKYMEEGNMTGSYACITFQRSVAAAQFKRQGHREAMAAARKSRSRPSTFSTVSMRSVNSNHSEGTAVRTVNSLESSTGVRSQAPTIATSHRS